MLYLDKCRTVNLLEIYAKQICGMEGFGQVSDDHLVPGQDQVPHDQGDNDHRCVNAKV